MEAVDVAASIPSSRYSSFYEGGDKLRSAVGHDFPREAMEFPDILKVKVCRSGSSDCGDRFNEVEVFAYRGDGHHDGVIST